MMPLDARIRRQTHDKGALSGALSRTGKDGPDPIWHAQTAEGPANRPLPCRQLVRALSGPAAQRRPELFGLEFEDEFDELLDELFEDEFELEFDEEFELELELEFDELLDELFEASWRRASVVATASVSARATRNTV